MDSGEKVYLKKVGANIKKIRVSKKIKQVDLADLCNIDKQNMYHIESGRHNLTLTSLLKISKALSVTIGEITDI